MNVLSHMVMWIRILSFKHTAFHLRNKAEKSKACVCTCVSKNIVTNNK